MFLERTGASDPLLDLFHDYRTNVEFYSRFQQWFRKNQLPTLVLWGQNDAIFAVEGAYAFQADMPLAQLELVESGRFDLEAKADELAPLICEFPGISLPSTTASSFNSPLAAARQFP
jgi:pimeloyl-ACP methyl ester carboxylesterase